MVNPRPPVECLEGPWTSFSACTVTCGGGTETRTREVTRPASSGGAACGELEQTQACNDDPCDGECWTIFVFPLTLHYGITGELVQKRVQLLALKVFSSTIRLSLPYFYLSNCHLKRYVE